MQHNALKILKQSKIVAKIISIDFDSIVGYSTLEIRVKLTNHWYLQVWEHETPVTRRYAYHVFDGDTMIVRWDNAPHHRDISTFPHHKHVSGEIVESEEMRIGSALVEIEKMI